MKGRQQYDMIKMAQLRYKVVSLPNFKKRREVVQMDTYQVLSLLLLGGNFLIALLAYIDRNNKRK